MKARFIIFTVIAMLLLAACAPATPIVPTPDVQEIRTSAAITVVAEFTLTAAANPPTITPEPPTATFTAEPPTLTPTIAFSTDPTQNALGTAAGPLCDDYDLGTPVDVTVPDGTPMTPGQEFVKTWRIKNTGQCAWGDGYILIYSYGEKMDGQPVPLGTVVESGQEIDVSVALIAPAKAGAYTGAWQMANAKGIPFGTKEDTLTVVIIVQ